MIRIAVIDDEDIVCSTIERYIMEVSTSINIQAEVEIFNTGEHFIDFINKKQEYDLIFLDIELDKLSGIDVGNHIRNILGNESTQIVFVSGKNGYDRQLFTFRPLDFVEKPVELFKIANVLKKYTRIYGNKSELFRYNFNRDNYFVNIYDILYFKSENRKVLIVKKDGTDEFYASIDKIAQQLGNKGFVIPHRSYLVNYRFIKSFRANEIIMTNSDHIPIPESRRKDMLNLQLIIENGGDIYDS